jgi:chromosome segregation ATPase
MRRRSQQASPPPSRRPHPDARIEAELQRILSLRATAARKESQVGQYQNEIAKLHDQLRAISHKNMTGNLYGGGLTANTQPVERRVAGLQGEIRKLETEVSQVHDEIGKRVEQLSDTDLAYLDGN